MTKRALDGVRVADFTWAWAGPYCCELLAFMGAEVIKIESMQRPDHSRKYSLTTGQVFPGMDSAWVFNDLNLNKLSININMAQPKGVELVKRLIKICDVAAQNMRPGVLDRLGLGYEDLKEVKPDIIMCSSSAFGATGPYRSYAGYAPVFALHGGMSYLTGYPDGTPANQGGSIDLRVGTTNTFAILAALNYRARTGKGQHIDISSSEAVSALIGDNIMEYSMNRRVPTRQGNRDAMMAPHNCYRCQGDDRWVSIAVGSEEEWQAFCQVIGDPDWTKDERFSDAYSRCQNQDELDKLITEWTSTRTDYEVMETLQRAGVAAMPSFSPEQIFDDPHIKARGAAQTIEHPVMGKRLVISPPWKLSETPADIYTASPLFGGHNQYVFGELLGMSQQEIASLEEEKVIY